MVSRYQYPHVFHQLVQGRRALHQIGQALFVLFGIFLLHWLALPLVFSYFAFASPIRSIVKNASGKNVAGPGKAGLGDQTGGTSDLPNSSADVASDQPSSTDVLNHTVADSSTKSTSLPHDGASSENS